jgi:hypothetical protein
VTEGEASRQLVLAIETLLGGGTLVGQPEKKKLRADSAKRA